MEFWVNKEMSDFFYNNEGIVVLTNHFKDWDHEIDAFACHEDHADVVLAMLDGAKGQCRLIGSNQAWSDCNLGVKGEWSVDFWYTSDQFESRIVATV